MRVSATPYLVAVLAVSAGAQQPMPPAEPDSLPAHSQPARAGERDLTAARQAAVQVQEAFAEVAQQVRPSVVTVRAYERIAPTRAPAEAAATPATGWTGGQTDEDYPGFRLLAAGSGFVVAEHGEVLTCLQPLQQKDGRLADLVDIELHDNTRVMCEIVGTEPTVNLAILQGMVYPNGHGKKVPALRFGDSDTLACGHWVLGFGDPAGPEKFFAVGSFIQLPARDCYQDYLSAFYLQIGMVAPPEACGGPLVNLAGEVVGMLAPRRPAAVGTAPQGPTGIELAMPSKILVGLFESIRQVKTSQSPWLGFSVMSRAEIAAARGIEAFQAMPKPRAGILVENVFRPGPAFAVGIAPGDFLCGFGDTRVFTPVDFQRCMYLAGVGKTVMLEFFRDGRTFRQELVIQARPREAMPR